MRNTFFTTILAVALSAALSQQAIAQRTAYPSPGHGTTGYPYYSASPLYPGLPSLNPARDFMLTSPAVSPYSDLLMRRSPNSLPNYFQYDVAQRVAAQDAAMYAPQHPTLNRQTANASSFYDNHWYGGWKDRR